MATEGSSRCGEVIASLLPPGSRRTAITGRSVLDLATFAAGTAAYTCDYYPFQSGHTHRRAVPEHSLN